MVQKLKILLVTNAFYPEISPRSSRATELAKEFCLQGHSVMVITKFRDHDYSEFFNEVPVTIKMWGKYRLPQVPDFKRAPFSLLSRGMKRLLLVLFEYPAIEDLFKVKRILRKEEGYDMMISFAVPFPVHWGVAWARSKKHRIAGTWIADCGDPYMGDVLDSFRKPFYFGFLEKSFSRKAEFISIPVESAIPAYYPEFHSKIRIIPQGFNFDRTDSIESRCESNIPQFAYAGRFLHGIRDPKCLMDYLVQINKPFRFYILTDQPELINCYSESLKDKLIISSYIPRPELMKKLSEMDFLISFDNNTTLNVPSKLIDYAITNRPVLNIDRSFTLEVLQAFIEGDYSNRMILPDLQKYHIKNVTNLFMELLPDNILG